VINIKELTEKDIGRWVVYKDFGREEHGRIASFTSEYVFVVYDRSGRDMNLFQHYTPVATDPEMLEFLE